MADGRHVAMVDGRHVGKYWKYHNSPSNQGRRHGFENEGDNFASGASQKIFLTPHFLASGGDKILLR